METTTEKRCEDKVKDSFDGRMEDIRELYQAEEHETEELGRLNDYGLCIDKVEAGTFEGQRENYIRYQLSYGGPTEEFRLYENGDMEFWYLDWYNGAKIDVIGKDFEIIKDIISWSGIEF